MSSICFQQCNSLEKRSISDDLVRSKRQSPSRGDESTVSLGPFFLLVKESKLNVGN